MKFKKLASLALACVMCVSLAVPAFAANNTETDITATYTPPVISVVVPQTADAFINPLGLDIKVDAANGPTLSGRQIISAPMTLKNQGATDLQVGATVSVTVNDSSDLRFVSTSTNGASAATKSVFAYVQAKQDKDLVGAETAVTATAIATAYGKWEASAYDSTKDIVVNSAMPATKDNLVILRAADMTGTNGAFKAYKPGSVALVRLAGDCTSTLTTGDGWVKTETTGSGDAAVTTGDGFTVNVAYTFKPASITKYDVTVDTSAVTDANASNVVTFTSSDAKAAAGDTVTLTLTTISGVTKAKVTVKDKSATPAAVTTDPADGVVETANTDTVSFVMPEGGVTITVAPTT